jgi:acyl-coenzyme A thioesterase PaaI-like protein
MPGAARGGLGVVRMNEAANASPLRQTFTPFMLALDSRVRGGNAQRIRLHLPFAPATCLRGGDATDLRAVASLLDHAGGAAVYAALPDLKATATLDLRMDLAGMPAAGQDVFVDAGCVAIDDGSALVVGEAWGGEAGADASARTPIARMTGRFVVGLGPGQRPGGDDRRAREARAAAHVPVVPPRVDSFDELLGGSTGGTVFTLPPAPWLVGSIALPALHGGAIAAGLMTAAQALAADPATEAPGLRLKSLTVQYLRAAHLEETRFDARVVKRGGRALYLAVDATQRGGERGIATLQCLYA